MSELNGISKAVDGIEKKMEAISEEIDGIEKVIPTSVIETIGACVSQMVCFILVFGYSATQQLFVHVN